MDHDALLRRYKELLDHGYYNDARYLFSVEAMTVDGRDAVLSEARDILNSKLAGDPGNDLLLALGSHLDFWDGKADFPFDGSAAPSGFSSFKEAFRKSESYGGTTFLSRRENEAKKIADGTFRLSPNDVERFGLAFNNIKPMLDLRKDAETFRILDIGGCLGEQYIAFRHYLDSEIRLDWTVVDLPDVVSIANETIKNPDIRFFDDLNLCESESFDLIIMSGFVALLEDPYSMLDRAYGMDCDFMFLDGVPMIEAGEDDVMMVSDLTDYGYVSYVLWAFSESKLNSYLLQRYQFMGLWENVKHKRSIIDADRNGYRAVKSGGYMLRKLEGSLVG